MDQVIVFRGDKLERLKVLLRNLTEDEVYEIRICVDEKGIEIYYENSVFLSPAMGDEETNGMD